MTPARGQKSWACRRRRYGAAGRPGGLAGAPLRQQRPPRDDFAMFSRRRLRRLPADDVDFAAIGWAARPGRKCDDARHQAAAFSRKVTAITIARPWARGILRP